MEREKIAVIGFVLFLTLVGIIVSMIKNPDILKRNVGRIGQVVFQGGKTLRESIDGVIESDPSCKTISVQTSVGYNCKDPTKAQRAHCPEFIGDLKVSSCSYDSICNKGYNEKGTLDPGQSKQTCFGSYAIIETCSGTAEGVVQKSECTSLSYECGGDTCDVTYEFDCPSGLACKERYSINSACISPSTGRVSSKGWHYKSGAILLNKKDKITICPNNAFNHKINVQEFIGTCQIIEETNDIYSGVYSSCPKNQEPCFSCPEKYDYCFTNCKRLTTVYYQGGIAGGVDHVLDKAITSCPNDYTYEITGFKCGIVTECGNTICESGEDQTNCPADCGCPLGYVFTPPNSCERVPQCGDNICDNNENANTCPNDCDPVCGNNIKEDDPRIPNSKREVCEIYETDEICDVGDGRVGKWSCVNTGPNACKAWTQCIPTPPECGNGIIEPPEECDPLLKLTERTVDPITGLPGINECLRSGPSACTWEFTPDPYCGDDICNGIETCGTCTQDCGICDVTIESIEMEEDYPPTEEIVFYIIASGGEFAWEIDVEIQKDGNVLGSNYRTTVLKETTGRDRLEVRFPTIELAGDYEIVVSTRKSDKTQERIEVREEFSILGSLNVKLTAQNPQYIDGDIIVSVKIRDSRGRGVGTPIATATKDGRSLFVNKIRKADGEWDLVISSDQVTTVGEVFFDVEIMVSGFENIKKSTVITIQQPELILISAQYGQRLFPVSMMLGSKLTNTLRVFTSSKGEKVDADIFTIEVRRPNIGDKFTLDCTNILQTGGNMFCGRVSKGVYSFSMLLDEKEQYAFNIRVEKSGHEPFIATGDEAPTTATKTSGGLRIPWASIVAVLFLIFVIIGLYQAAKGVTKRVRRG